MRYITSDTHFHHKNIILFENGRRHFKDVEEMNETIVSNWNAVVTNNDTVYHLGDLGIANDTKILEVVSHLKGNIKLVPGNHDKTSLLKRLEALPNVEVMPLMFKEKHHKKIVYFTHYPVMLGSDRKNLFCLHGHIHAHETSFWNHLNVGVDADIAKHLPFGQPVPFDDVLSEMLSRFDHMESSGLLGNKT